MKKIVIGDIVSRAWDLAVKHWPIFVLLSLVTSLISGLGTNIDPVAYSELISGNIPPAEQMAKLSEAIQMNYPLAIIGFLLTIYAGYIGYNLYVNAVRLGKPYETMGQIFKVDINQLAIYFAVDLVYGIIVGLGCCLCILPGIWIGVRLMYAPLLAATQGASFGEAFSRSWEMTKGSFWDLFLLGLVAIGIAILGFVACCVGYLFAAVIIEFMLVLSFFVLKGNDPEPEVYAKPEPAPAPAPEAVEQAAETVQEATDYVEVQ